MLNVGVLSRNAEFATGPVPARMMPLPRRRAASPKNLTRGYHFCEFCLDPLSSAPP